MDEFLEAIEVIAKRLFGVYGKSRTKVFFEKHNITIDDNAKILKYDKSITTRDLLIRILNDMEKEFGVVARITTKTALISYFLKKNISLDKFKDILY